MSMSFLNRPNFEYVLGLALQYLQDTNTLYVTEQELHKLVADTMLQIQNTKDRDKEELDVEKWNKQTILTVRDIVRQRAPKPATAQLENVATSAAVDSDPFFTKLQELEVSRKSGNVWMGAETAPTPSVPTPSAPIIVPSTVSTIYMQAPPEKATAIHIRSWHRSWLNAPLRAAFTWSGPLPTSIDVNSMYLSTVIVPKQTMIWTPYVILEMEGAGGQVNECILTPDSNSVSNTWEYLRPCTRSIGYIRPLALPWKLRLLDADRELLPFGRDHWKVQSIQHIGLVSRLTVGANTGGVLNKDFTSNEWLLLSGAGVEVRCKVVAVGPTTIDVDELVDMKLLNAHILHLHRQSCVVLEASQTTHAKK